MTVKDIADVDLDWCTDVDISYEKEQKHESGEDVVIPVIGQFIPAEQHSLSKYVNHRDTST